MTAIHHDAILIVDDDAADVEFTSHVIKEKIPNVRLQTAKNGEEALNLIFGKDEHTENSIAGSPSQPEQNHSGTFWIPKISTLELIPLRAVLLDLHMPGIDGFDVLRILKSHDATKYTPVIILSSSREAKDIERCYLLGANSYIVKPIDAEQFEQTIEKLVAYWLGINELFPSSIDIDMAHL
ncbi:MAG: response regulator [Bacteroidota bacterium]|nr:response regulator [Bacteroidota bacterium]